MSYFDSGRCAECPRLFHPIPGCGSDPSRILFIGDRPGKQEQERLRIAIGKTGEEMDFTYLPLAHLHRQEVRIENVVRCFALGNRPASDKEVQSCAHHFLPRVLGKCKPEVVVLMGGTAHKIIDVPPGQKRPRVDVLHGRPFYGSILNGTWEGWIWSSYHPALGIHDTTKMTDLMDDFTHLGQWLEDDWTPPQIGVDVDKKYYLVDKPAQVVFYIRAHKESDFRVVGTDTESHGREPWSVQVSLADHTGILVRTNDTATSAELARGMNTLITDYGWDLGFHHAPADLGICEQLGIRSDKFRDTMQEAFHQCSLPQGLKTLAFRLLGVKMTSWEDVVWPASIDAATDWIVSAIDAATDSLTSTTTTYMKTYVCKACGHRAHPGGVCKSKAGGRVEKCGCDRGDKFSNAKHTEKPGAIEKILRHILRYTIETAEADDPYDPWMALYGIPSSPGMLAKGLRGDVPEPWEWEWLEETLGKMPILGIANAPLDRAIAYACSDADMTRLVAKELEAGRGSSKWEIAEGDEDK